MGCKLNTVAKDFLLMALALLLAFLALGLSGCGDRQGNSPSYQSGSHEGSNQPQLQNGAGSSNSSSSGAVSGSANASSEGSTGSNAMRKGKPIYYTQEISASSSRWGEDAYTVVSTAGDEVDIPEGYEVVGPCASDAFMVRWLDEGDDSWGAGADETYRYGFMDVRGEVLFTLEDALASIGLPLENDNGVDVQCDSGAYYQEGRAVLTCRYGKPNSQVYGFHIILDSKGNVVAWSGIDAHHIDVEAAASIPYTSFEDVSDAENSLAYISVEDAYRDGYLYLNGGVAFSSEHTILLSMDGNTHADFRGEDISAIRSTSSANDSYVLAGDSAVYSYAPGVDARHIEALVEAEDLAEGEGFDDAELAGIMGDGALVAVNGTKSTAKGERSKAGLYDFELGEWVLEPVLGAVVNDVYGGVCAVSVSGGYSDSLEDGAGLLGAGGDWILEPGSLVGGRVVTGASHYIDSLWLLKTTSKSDGATYLIDVDDTNAAPVLVDEITGVGDMF